MGRKGNVEAWAREGVECEGDEEVEAEDEGAEDVKVLRGTVWEGEIQRKHDAN